MNLKVWFKKEILKQVPSLFYGNLEMSCYCYDHMDHKNCDDEKCHNGFDRQMAELEKKDVDNGL